MTVADDDVRIGPIERKKRQTRIRWSLVNSFALRRIEPVQVFPIKQQKKKVLLPLPMAVSISALAANCGIFSCSLGRDLSTCLVIFSWVLLI